MNSKPHFSLLATSFAGGPRPRNAALILGGLWLLLFFAALFTPPLLNDADATHALAAHSMAQTGDLVTLHVNGIRYLEKAPLLYWLAALSVKIFGANTFAAHLPIALAVLLLTLVGHRWGNQAFGSRTGFYTALGILTSAGVFLFTRILIPEALLSLFLAVALYAFLRSLTQLTPRPIDLQHRGLHIPEPPTTPERPGFIFPLRPATYPYLMWSALALAVLSKGLVALALFAAPALLYLLLVDEWRLGSTWRKLRPFTGLLLFLLIAAPWHIAAGLRNTGAADGHGFFWFYFWNEHVLRFLGRRQPQDYNKLPGLLFWLQHLLWLFPWSLFLPLGITAVWRRTRHQNTLTNGTLIKQGWLEIALIFAVVFALSLSRSALHYDIITFALLIWTAVIATHIARTRRLTGLAASPFHRIDAQQRSILLLALFAGTVLLFFAISTNQEYYTFPAYLPLLLLIASTITRAEQTYSSSPGSQRWLTFAHAAFMLVGALVALALGYGLWSARHLPFEGDIGGLLAHRGIGSYTLSTSHLFDLTGPSFAALRLPAVLAILCFLIGPALSWMLRMQRRHLAATTTIALTAAGFLFAAHVAFARFAPMLSSRDFAVRLQQLENDGSLDRQSHLLLFGDLAYGSSLPFYADRQAELVDGKTTSMQFGASFPDAPQIFLTHQQLQQQWGRGERKIIFVPAELRDQFDSFIPVQQQTMLKETSGKVLITDRPLNGVVLP